MKSWNAFRAFFGSGKTSRVIGRRELIGSCAERIWRIGCDESIHHASPQVYGGAIPPRMLEFTHAMTLDAPFVTEVPGVEFISVAAVRPVTSKDIFGETLRPGDEERLKLDSLPLAWQLKPGVEYDTAFCIAHRQNRSYFHWIMDSLPLLESYEFYRQKTGVRPLLIVDEELTTFQRDSLELLGYTGVDYVLRPARRIKVKCMVIASRRRTQEREGGASFDAISPAACRWLRNRILTALPDPGSIEAVDQNIYITRRSASARRVQNEDELVSFLKLHRFKSYCLEEMAFVDQVILFARAKMVVGPHGSGLANLLWASKDATLIELMPDNRIHPDYFQLARVSGLRYAVILCKTSGDAGDMTIDMSEFKRCFLDMVPILQ